MKLCSIIVSNEIGYCMELVYDTIELSPISLQVGLGQTHYEPVKTLNVEL